MLNFKDFDSLPDSALVPVTAFRVLAGIAPSTAWRRTSLEPDFPKPVRLGNRCTRFRVGEIRGFLAGKASAPAASAASATSNRTRLLKAGHE